jgi:peroxiredoxin
LHRWLSLFLLTAALSSPGVAAAQEGTAAPAFSVRDLDGHTIRLQDLRGRPVVLDFWATWCAPCRTSMPDLDQIQDRYTGQGLVILGLSLDEDGAQPVRRFAQGIGVKFRMALANDRVLAQYGPIRSVPTTVFINRKGIVVRRVVGYVDRETMEGFVRELF